MKKFIVLSVLALLPVFANATINGMESPVGGGPGSPVWRLQNYVNGSVVLWNTQATGNCGASVGGNIQLNSSNSTTEERNRFWSLIETARTSGASVYIEYESSSCAVTSFSLD